MSAQEYKVELLPPEEAASFLAQRERPYLGKGMPKSHRKIFTDGFEMTGRFELIARDSRSGEIDWQHEQENLITDTGRSAFYDVNFLSTKLGFAPSQETPNILRNSIGTDGSQTVVTSVTVSPTNIPATFTKQWTTTFVTPATNRTLGIIFLSGNVVAVDANVGPVVLWSYSLLTPPKTQTTVQTLEVIYKLSINAIY